MARTFLITGGAGGIGKATAELLTSRGHTAITADIQNADINADLTTAEGRQQLVDETERLSGGKLDGIIANAGMQAPTPKTAQVNFFGAVATLEGLRPLLLKSDAPRAVVTASIASLQPADEQLVNAMLDGDEEATVKRGLELCDEGPQQAYLNYSSSKQAIARWVRRSAITDDWAGQGIALNAIAPAVVISPMTEELRNTEEGRAQLAQVPMPLNSWMPAESAANLIAWLVSEENTHLCGQVIFIDGGFDATVRGDSSW